MKIRSFDEAEMRQLRWWLMLSGALFGFPERWGRIVQGFLLNALTVINSGRRLSFAYRLLTMNCFNWKFNTIVSTFEECRALETLNGGGRCVWNSTQLARFSNRIEQNRWHVKTIESEKYRNFEVFWLFPSNLSRFIWCGFWLSITFCTTQSTKWEC